MNRIRLQASAAVSILLLVATSASAESLVSSMGMYVYPSNSQTAEQQSKDDYECFSWAKGESHYDPMSPNEVTAAPAEQGASGERARGALRGAAGGAIIGEVASDDAGKGAAIGATLGVLRGGRQARHNQDQAEQQAEQAAAQANTNNANQFKNAYSACMEGRQYSVKF